MQPIRVIRFDGFPVRESDAVVYLVSRGIAPETARVLTAKRPASLEAPQEYRHFVANLAAADRRAAEWNARQQWKVGA